MKPGMQPEDAKKTKAMALPTDDPSSLQVSVRGTQLEEAEHFTYLAA